MQRPGVNLILLSNKALFIKKKSPFGGSFRFPFGLEPWIRVICSSPRHGKIAEKMARKIACG
jgi:hypothetical protein